MLLRLCLGVFFMVTSTITSAQDTSEADPFLWLEDIEGERALQWVREQNQRSLAKLTQDERYPRYYAAALAIAQDQQRIPFGSLRNGWLYNFWQDEHFVRGIWRRATVAQYETAAPEWQILLDIDALAKTEQKNWVFEGVECLPQDSRYCLVKLSDGGKDAIVMREFDTEKRTFVEGGFLLPEAKSDVVWRDANSLLVATDWGDGTLTESGYPFVVKEWRRGQALAAAREVYRGKVTDVAVSPFSLEGPNKERFLGIRQADTFFTATHWRFSDTQPLARLSLPPKASVHGIFRGQLIFTLEQDWTVDQALWRAGTLLALPMSELTAQAPKSILLWMPGPRESIESVEISQSAVLVASYAEVKGRVLRFSLTQGRWTYTPMPLPSGGSVEIISTDPQIDTAFLSHEDFLRPTALYAAQVSNNSAKRIKNLDAKFPAEKYLTEQFMAVSRDGTEVPYFVVRTQGKTTADPAPTLLYGYGGFQVAMLPSYSATLGQLWLEQGGVYVLANIRGGGEFGPQWHQAGLKTKRQVIYDDFIAVAEDLITRKITSSEHLGMMGGSNGGLLMGAMLTQRPELFNAAVVQVPLLDMLRYHQLLAGASWVDEYGSPEVPEERQWLRKLSPYHNLVRRDDFPLPFILTSTKDDRVHPGHARKYAAKLASLDMPFLYYENIDGGHSAAANLQERAKRQALEFTYLAQRLMR
jgi:prolyl oligopeptidase